MTTVLVANSIIMGIFIVIVVLSPTLAGVLTYRLLIKLIKAEESWRIVKITLTIIINSSFYKIIDGFY